MKFDLESLKSSLEEAKLVNIARERAKPSARGNIRRLEKELKDAKRIYNRLILDIRESKRRQKRLKRYISSYPRNLKNWTEKNFGILINRLEDTKQ